MLSVAMGDSFAGTAEDEKFRNDGHSVFESLGTRILRVWESILRVDGALFHAREGRK